MPDSKKDPTKKETDKWITIGGKKIKIPAGEEGEDYIREKLPSAKGVKESGTKQAQKTLQRRFGLIKSPFKIREEVVFDQYKKSGIIAGFDGDMIKILSNNRIFRIQKNDAYKVNELIGGYHWDTLTNNDRADLLKQINAPTDLANRNWGNLTEEIRSVLKEGNPAGYTTSTSGTHNPIYNPVNEEKTLSDRIDSEIKRQREDKGEDEEKGKD